MSATNGFLSIYYVEYIQKGECSSHALRPFFHLLNQDPY